MPVDPRHLSAVRDLLEHAHAAVADAELAADAAYLELLDQGAHPAVCAGMLRVRDHARCSLGLIGAAAGHLVSVRAAYARHEPAAHASLPTEGQRTGGVYIGRQRAAQGT